MYFNCISFFLNCILFQRLFQNTIIKLLTETLIKVLADFFVRTIILIYGIMLNDITISIRFWVHKWLIKQISLLFVYVTFTLSIWTFVNFIWWHAHYTLWKSVSIIILLFKFFLLIYNFLNILLPRIFRSIWINWLFVVLHFILIMIIFIYKVYRIIFCLDWLSWSQTTTIKVFWHFFNSIEIWRHVFLVIARAL